MLKSITITPGVGVLYTSGQFPIVSGIQTPININGLASQGYYVDIQADIQSNRVLSLPPDVRTLVLPVGQ